MTKRFNAGEISTLAAQILIRDWYEANGFSHEEIYDLMAGQLAALFEGETFELGNDLGITCGSNGKFYLRKLA